MLDRYAHRYGWTFDQILDADADELMRHDRLLSLLAETRKES